MSGLEASSLFSVKDQVGLREHQVRVRLAHRSFTLQVVLVTGGGRGVGEMVSCLLVPLLPRLITQH
jgi:hypothetical protein